MNAKSEQPASKSGTQQESLRVFLANEREIYRYVAALVPPTADAEAIVQQTAVVLWEKFDQYGDPREATNLAADYPEVVKRLNNSGKDYWESQAALYR